MKNNNELSVIYKFQLMSFGFLKPDFLNISINDYFKKIGEDLKSIPYEKPLVDFIDVFDDESTFNDDFTKLSKWRLDCINSKQWRLEAKQIIIQELKETYKYIKGTEDKNLIISSLQLDYKIFVKELIDNWLQLFETINFENESLENLLIFCNFLDIAVDENKVKLERQRQELLKEEFWNNSDSRDEKRYWSDPINQYYEGGGGNEWSDSSDFF